MKEFLFVFRRDAEAFGSPTPEQMQAMLKHWQDWIANLAAQNKLIAKGRRLDFEGKVVRPDKTVTNGPFVEVKESIAGYMHIKADSLDEATELAKGCPVLQVGGNVEVRPLMPED